MRWTITTFRGPRTGAISATVSMLLAIAVLASAEPAAAQVGGVYVDAEGMLRETSALSPSDLERLRREAAVVASAGDVAASSPLRKVSLRRLEESLARSAEPSAEARCLAGLTAVRWVFFYPEQNDVILAGPAEGWRQLPSGDVVGSNSGRSVLQLEDLVVALRYAFAGERESFIGCSIEPTEQGVQSYERFVSGIRRFDRSQGEPILRGMEQAMGPQNVLVYGVAPTSRFALKLIAADYRLKRLALAHDRSPVKDVPSYLDIAARAGAGGPQHRWWFVGHYDAIRHTADRRAYEFEGPGLRVDTAPSQSPAAQGAPAAKPSRAATLFAEAATRGFAKLAEKVPPFADLQNLVGLAVAAELIRQNADANAAAARGEEAERATPPHGWRPGRFLDEEALPLAVHPVPRQAPSLANARQIRGRQWLFTVSGGVEIVPEALAAGRALQVETGGALAGRREASAPPEETDRWWWD